MKVDVRVPFYDRNGLHKKGDVVEIETAAFNPRLMSKVQTPETKSAPVPFIEEAVADEEKVEKPKRTRKKKV